MKDRIFFRSVFIAALIAFALIVDELLLNRARPKVGCGSEAFFRSPRGIIVRGARTATYELLRYLPLDGCLRPTSIRQELAVRPRKACIFLTPHEYRLSSLSPDI